MHKLLAHMHMHADTMSLVCYKDQVEQAGHLCPSRAQLQANRGWAHSRYLQGPPCPAG